MVNAEMILRKEHPKIFRYPSMVNKTIVGLMRLVLHEKSINRFMEEHHEKTGLDFVNAVLEHLNVSDRKSVV